MLKVYVAGSVYEKDYRAQVAREYSEVLNIFDPLKEIEAGVLNVDISKVDDLKTIPFGDDEIKKIVELDKAAIDTCDIVVAYVRRYSAGTIMEILHAWNNQTPVYLIVEKDSQFEKDVWLKYHTTKFFYSIKSCFDYIVSTLEYSE